MRAGRPRSQEISFSWLPVTMTRNPSPRPRTSCWYIISAHGAGWTKLPWFTARTRKWKECEPAGSRVK